MTAQERETNIRNDLVAYGYVPEMINSETFEGRSWRVQIHIKGRAFTFESESRDGFSFFEIEDDKSISFTRHLSAPILMNDSMALTNSVEMIVHCLLHPEFKGQNQAVI